MKQKRSIALLLAMSMCASAFAFTACGETAHTEHTPSEWKSDDTNHWKVCTECGAELEKAAHSFKDGVCSVCNKADPNADKPDDGEEELPPLPYDPNTDKETPGLDYVEITNEEGAIKGYRVEPGARFDREIEELFLPQRHNNMPVLCVGLDEDAYKEASEAGMSDSELNAFYQENCFYNIPTLKTVHIGAETTVIGPVAFGACTALETVELSDRIQSIGSLAFAGCSISEIKLPEGLTSIGFNAFQLCTKLEKINCPSTLKTIDDSAFMGDSGLKEVTLSKKITRIGANAFNNCTALETIAFPDSLEEIGDSAFARAGLKSIDFGNGVYKFGEKAFFGCSSLDSIEIPDCVTEVGKDCFAESSSSSTDAEGNEIYTGLKSVKIGSGLEVISEGMFRYCFALENLETTGTREIAANAFSACRNLVNVKLGEGLEMIGSAAFWSCLSLTEIVFPDSLYNIGNSAFMSCKALLKVQLGKNITVIEPLAFDGCSNIKNVIYNGSYNDYKDFVDNGGGLPTPNEFLG